MPSGHSIELTPNVPGAVPFEIVGTAGPYGVFTTEFTPPVVEYEETWAESTDTEGAQRIGSRARNPGGSGKLRVVKGSSADFWNQMDEIQKVLESMRRYKGTIRHEPPGGTAVTFDVEAMRLSGFPQDRSQAMMRAEPEFEFTTKPYGRLDPYWEIAAGAPASSSDPLLRFEATDVPGSADALGRLIIRDGASKARRHVEWGLGDAADLPAGGHFIDSANLVTAGFAGTQQAAGAFVVDPTYGAGNNVIRAVLNAQPQVLCGTGPLTHTGPLKLKGRLNGQSTGKVYVRIAYRVADGDWTRTPWRLVSGTAMSYYEVDLAKVSIDRTAMGAHSWEARIEAYTDTTGSTVAIDYLEIFPAKRTGKARSPQTLASPSVYTARDEFEQTAGALHGKSLPAPAATTWAKILGTTDATVDATNQVVTRSVNNNDIGLWLAGATNYAHIAVALDFRFRSGTLGVNANSTETAAYLRYVDANNWLRLRVRRLQMASDPLGSYSVWVEKNKAGVLSYLTYGIGWMTSSVGDDQWWRIAMLADAAGNWTAYRAARGGTLLPVVSGQDADLATGGTHATGRIGFYDVLTNSTGTGVRDYDNFAAWVPEFPAPVIPADGDLEVRHNTALRGPNGSKPLYEGNYLKIPPAGREGKASVIVAKARRNDVDIASDSHIADNTKALLEITPRVALSTGV